MIYNEYNKIFDEIKRLSGSINLASHLRPTNLDEEKIKFFKNKCQVNPQFEYNRIRASNIDLLKNLQIPKGEIGELAREKRERIIKLKNLLQTNSDKNFIRISSSIFQKPIQSYLGISHKILQKNPVLIEGPMLSIEEIKYKIEKELAKFPTKIDLIIIDEPSFANKITASKSSITISKQYHADEEEVEDLLAHELESHIRRSYNGSLHPLTIFKYGSAKYLESEEGLANIMGVLVRKNKLLVHPAFLHLALETALQTDFVTTFREIKKYLDDDNRAWTYTLRAKRGIRDTSIAGAYTKDLYLQYALETAKKIIKKPELLETAFDGLGHIEELYKFKTDKPFKHNLTLSDVKEVHSVNVFE